MKNAFLPFAVALSVARMACASEVVVSNGVLWAESPLDFEIGSTKYAEMLGKRLRSTASATYDPQTKVTTTNMTWAADARLAKPFYGHDEVYLSFKGEDKRLDNVHLFRCPVVKEVTATALNDCRKTLREIASDIERRRGVKMKEMSGMDNEELTETLEKDDKSKDVSHGFSMMLARCETNDVVVNYWLEGWAGKKSGCYISLRAYASDPDESGLDGIVTKDERKKAHAEAAKMRATLKRVFGEDFDAEPENRRRKFDPAKEWAALDIPVAGMTEKKVSRSNILFGIPMVTLSFRRAYDGDVEADELDSVAKGFLALLEKEYGETIPECDAEDGQKEVSLVFGDGVPAYGDTRAAFQLDRTQVFVGKIGDVAVEIAYALPQYRREGDAFEVVVRGAVIANIVQMPILSAAKSKK